MDVDVDTVKIIAQAQTESIAQILKRPLYSDNIMKNNKEMDLRMS